MTMTGVRLEGLEEKKSIDANGKCYTCTEPHELPTANN